MSALKNDMTQADQNHLHERWATDEYAFYLNALLTRAPAAQWYDQCPKTMHQWENALTGDFRGIDLQRRELDGLDLMGMSLDHSNFTGARFNKTMLQGASISHAKFLNAHFNATQMLPIYGEFASFIGAEFHDAHADEAVLRYADFERAVLNNVRLDNGRLKGSSFKRAELSECNLQMADLSDTSFDGAVLKDCELRFCHLENSSFNGASILGCNMTGVDLTQVDFHGLKEFANVRFGAEENGYKIFRTRLPDSPEGRRLLAGSQVEGRDEIEWVQVPSFRSSPKRVVGNELCPRAGFWFTPAKMGSRRYFQVGAVMPVVGGDYGDTIWQWDENQNPPTL